MHWAKREQQGLTRLRPWTQPTDFRLPVVCCVRPAEAALRYYSLRLQRTISLQPLALLSQCGAATAKALQRLLRGLHCEKYYVVLWYKL